MSPLSSILFILLAAAPPAPVSRWISDDPLVAGDTFERIVRLARDESHVMDHLDLICRQIGPRLTGSSNFTKACEACRDLLEAIGLEDVHLEEYGTFPVGFDREPSSGRIVAPLDKELGFGTMAWTAGTDGPVRARAVLAPASEEDLESFRDEISGCWVLYDPRFTGERSAARETRQARGRLDRAVRQLCDEQGAAGLITPVSGEKIMFSGNPRISWEERPTRVQIRMVRSHFDEIVELIEGGKEVDLEFDIGNRFVQGPIPLHNVVGEIRGSRRPEEVVIIAAHLDCWDGAQGVIDNGCGCAVAIEAMRLLIESGARPERTVRIILFGGEEQGLLGSRAYVEAHADEMERVSAVFVHDMGTNAISGISVTPAMKDDAERIFAPIRTLDESMPFEVRIAQDGLRGGGSDHASFLSAGVPGFFWRQSGRAVYSDAYHNQFDRMDQAIPEYLRHSSSVIALTALGVSDLDHLLSREKLQAPRAMARATRRRMGISLASDGVTIESIVQGTLAEKAGWKAGDRIVAVDGTTVANRTALITAIYAGEPHKVITIERDGHRIEAVFDWRPRDRSGG